MNVESSIILLFVFVARVFVAWNMQNSITSQQYGDMAWGGWSGPFPFLSIAEKKYFVHSNHLDSITASPRLFLGSSVISKPLTNVYCLRFLCVLKLVCCKFTFICDYSSFVNILLICFNGGCTVAPCLLGPARRFHFDDAGWNQSMASNNRVFPCIHSKIVSPEQNH